MSTTNVIPFTFEGQRVRSIRMGEETVFVAMDVAKILRYSSAKDMTRNLDKDEKGRHEMPTPGGIQVVQTITEPGLYHIINLRKAGWVKNDKAREMVQRFQHWVNHEVIPQIRRTGGYIPVAEQDDEKVILSKAVLILNRTLGEKDRLLADRQKTIDRQRPLAALGESFLSVDGTMTITKAARHFQTIDRGMTRDMVFGLLRGAGYLEQAGNAPTVKAIRPGYLKQKVAKRRDGRMGRPYAVFTPKGINWFIRRFIYAEGQGQFDMEVAA